MSVPPAEMPIRRRILRALAMGRTVKGVARLYGLPPDFVAGVAAGRQPKTARRRGVKKGIAAADSLGGARPAPAHQAPVEPAAASCLDGNGRVAAPVGLDDVPRSKTDPINVQRNGCEGAPPDQSPGAAPTTISIEAFPLVSSCLGGEFP